MGTKYKFVHSHGHWRRVDPKTIFVDIRAQPDRVLTVTRDMMMTLHDARRVTSSLNGTTSPYIEQSNLAAIKLVGSALVERTVPSFHPHS